MKKITIYSIGSCNPNTRKGKYEAVLEYGENRKYICAIVEDTTSNRCIIQGFIDGVKTLKEPCEIDLVSTTKVGLSGLRKNKGPNIDLLKELVSLLSEKDCLFEFKEETGEGEEINQHISKYKK